LIFNTEALYFPSKQNKILLEPPRPVLYSITMPATTDTQPKADEVGMEKMGAIDLQPTSVTSVQDAMLPLTDPPSSAASLSEKPTDALKTPIVDPVGHAKPGARPDLSSKQQAMYDTLLAAVKEWKEVPSSTGKAGPIVDEEIMWLTHECLLRYLRATKWSINEASKRLLATLSWRRDYGVTDLADGMLVSPENETGKQLLLGYDNAARPCIYLSPGRQNTQAGPRQVQHLVFTIERAIEFMAPGQETLALLINFKQSKNRSNTAPGIGQGREVLNILQTHFPERLGRACIINGT
jgi:CRAL/TRIO domain/CRAL/TRIO, N-terminal domain